LISKFYYLLVYLCITLVEFSYFSENHIIAPQKRFKYIYKIANNAEKATGTSKLLITSTQLLKLS